MNQKTFSLTRNDFDIKSLAERKQRSHGENNSINTTRRREKNHGDESISILLFRLEISCVSSKS